MGIYQTCELYVAQSVGSWSVEIQCLNRWPYNEFREE